MKKQEGIKQLNKQKKLYRIILKNVQDNFSVLEQGLKSKKFFFKSGADNAPFKSKFTKQELEQAGFGGVFDNPMFEVEEVD